MKKMKIVFILNFLTIISSAQYTETNIEKIYIYYRDSLNIQEQYLIYIKQNTIEYINPRQGDAFERNSVSIKIKKKKWNKIINLIDKINLVIEDSTLTQDLLIKKKPNVVYIDYDYDYYWCIVYSEDEQKGYKIRSENAPTALTKLFAILKRNKRLIGKRGFNL